MQNANDSLLLAPFLNREDGTFDFSGWFHLVPKGTFPIVRKEGDKKVVYQQVVDDDSVNRIVSAFANRQKSDPSYRLLIDFDHFSHDLDKSSEAAAWINRMEVRDDGVWAKADWSDAGEAAIKNRRYRYLSPVWLPSQVEKIGAQRVRPVAVSDAALTNKPNLGAAIQPFWNRADDFHGQPASENQNQNTMNPQLIALLGLAATASEADIITKVTAFKNRAAEADALQAKFDTLTTEHAAFKNRHDALLATSVDRALEEHKALITEESKEAWKNRLTADFTGTVALLKGIKAPAAGGKPVHQPGKSDAAAAGASAEANQDGGAFLNRAAAIATERKISPLDAQVALAGEDPAAYEAYRKELGLGKTAKTKAA